MNQHQNKSKISFLIKKLFVEKKKFNNCSYCKHSYISHIILKLKATEICEASWQKQAELGKGFLFLFYLFLFFCKYIMKAFEILFPKLFHVNKTFNYSILMIWLPIICILCRYLKNNNKQVKQTKEKVKLIHSTVTSCFKLLEKLFIPFFITFS